MRTGISDGTSPSAWRRAAFVAAAAMALTAGVGAGQAAAIARPGAAAPAHRPAGASHIVKKMALDSVSCTGTSFCMAVGSYETWAHPHQARPLTEIWNGRMWRVGPGPARGRLYSVTCGTRSFCLGTGIRTGVEIWNGRTWRIWRHQPGTSAISCGAPTLCLAIYQQHLIKKWNGRRWRIVTQIDACAPGGSGTCEWTAKSCWKAGNCMVAGSVTTDPEGGVDEVAARWTGSGWVRADPPLFADTLACAGREFCMVDGVKIGGIPAAAIWADATGWKDVSPDLAVVCPNVDCQWNTLISCGSPANCMVLSQTPVSLAWNGSSWKPAPYALVAGNLPRLRNISCGNAATCMAVGGIQRGGLGRSLAEYWNGTAWKATRIPAP